MIKCVKAAIALLIGGLLLLACQKSDPNAEHPTETATPALVMQEIITPRAAESAVLLPRNASRQDDAYLLASRQHGLMLLDEKGALSPSFPGRFDYLDYRSLDDGNLVFATFDRQQQKVMVNRLLPATANFSMPVYLPELDFAVEALCLFQDPQKNLQLFIVGEEGRGQQWLLTAPQNARNVPQLIRDLSLPNSATRCAVDDVSQAFFVNEENVGVWRYEANPESDQQRRLVALVKPFGTLNSVDEIAVVDSALYILSADDQSLTVWLETDLQWHENARWSVAPIEEPESMSFSRDNQSVRLSLRDDQNGKWWRASLPATLTPKITPPIVTVTARAQTASAVAHGDAADDPAIWVHPLERGLSRVIATDKKFGLLVYDLNGKRLQTLAGGDLNNVDVRQGLVFGNQTVDVAVASNRTTNSLAVYRIDPRDGVVTEWAQLATGLNDIYGLCLYSPKAGDVQVVANDKDGRFFQFRLGEQNGELVAEKLREFRVASQPEACVSDDETHQLFVGEEDVGVWQLPADPSQAAALTPVITVGDSLSADVEGLGLYRANDHRYLVISSQGNDSYVVLEAQPPFKLMGRFRVGLNADDLIDGVSETDGLEVSAVNFGGDYDEGLLVLQDGRKRLPQGKQNFKYVAWRDIRVALNLP